MLPITLADVEEALNIRQQHAALQARDSIHAAVMMNNRVQRILSADVHFDGVDQVQRLDPLLWTQISSGS